MQRKTTTAPTRVYSYGCSFRGVTKNADLVEEQYRRAHAYQQKLVELELQRRAAVRAVLATDAGVVKLAEVVAQHEKALTDDLVAAAAIKQATRSKKLPPELRDRLAQTKQDLRAARDAWKAARRLFATDPNTKAALDKTNTDHVVAVKAARAASGLAWGTYLILERAADQQRNEKMDPKHRGYTGEGRLAVQFQGGTTVAGVFGGEDTRMRIEPKPGGSRKRHICKLRIGSDGRAPIWAEIEVFIHRQLPADSRITWARLKRTRRGRDYLYDLQITLESQTFAGVLQDMAHRRVAVDLGWRVTDKGAGGLRVAYWRDSDGRHEELRLPAKLLSSLDYPDQLLGIETNWFERAKAKLLAWRADVVLPEEHRSYTGTLAHWQSPLTLASYVWWWREHRFAGDELIFATMDEWRVRRFWHYRDWRMFQRDKALAARKDFYCVFASKLVVDCKELVLEDFDLSAFATKDTGPSAFRYWRRTGAPSELRLCLIAAAKKVGAKITLVDPAMTTRRCQACGSEEPWDQKTETVHTCKTCGTTWDQDDNATINMLASGSMVSGTSESLDPAE